MSSAEHKNDVIHTRITLKLTVILPRHVPGSKYFVNPGNRLLSSELNPYP